MKIAVEQQRKIHISVPRVETRCKQWKNVMRRMSQENPDIQNE